MSDRFSRRKFFGVAAAALGSLPVVGLFLQGGKSARPPAPSGRSNRPTKPLKLNKVNLERELQNLRACEYGRGEWLYVFGDEDLAIRSPNGLWQHFPARTGPTYWASPGHPQDTRRDIYCKCAGQEMVHLLRAGDRVELIARGHWPPEEWPLLREI